MNAANIAYLSMNYSRESHSFICTLFNSYSSLTPQLLFINSQAMESCLSLDPQTNRSPESVNIQDFQNSIRTWIFIQDKSAQTNWNLGLFDFNGDGGGGGGGVVSHGWWAGIGLIDKIKQ